MADSYDDINIEREETGVSVDFGKFAQDMANAMGEPIEAKPEDGEPFLVEPEEDSVPVSDELKEDL